MNIGQQIIADPHTAMHFNNTQERTITFRPVEPCEKGSLAYFQVLDVFNESAILSSHGLVSPLSNVGDNLAVR